MSFSPPRVSKDMKQIPNQYFQLSSFDDCPEYLKHSALHLTQVERVEDANVLWHLAAKRCDHRLLDERQKPLNLPQDIHDRWQKDVEASQSPIDDAGQDRQWLNRLGGMVQSLEGTNLTVKYRKSRKADLGRMYGSGAQILPKNVRALVYGQQNELDFVNCQPKILYDVMHHIHQADVHHKLPMLARYVTDRDGMIDDVLCRLQGVADTWREQNKFDSLKLLKPKGEIYKEMNRGEDPFKLGRGWAKKHLCKQIFAKNGPVKAIQTPVTAQLFAETKQCYTDLCTLAKTNANGWLHKLYEVAHGEAKELKSAAQKLQKPPENEQGIRVPRCADIASWSKLGNPKGTFLSYVLGELEHRQLCSLYNFIRHGVERWNREVEGGLQVPVAMSLIFDGLLAPFLVEKETLEMACRYIEFRSRQQSSPAIVLTPSLTAKELAQVDEGHPLRQLLREAADQSSEVRDRDQEVVRRLRYEARKSLVCRFHPVDKRDQEYSPDGTQSANQGPPWASVLRRIYSNMDASFTEDLERNIQHDLEAKDDMVDRERVRKEEVVQDDADDFQESWVIPPDRMHPSDIRIQAALRFEEVARLFNAKYYRLTGQIPQRGKEILELLSDGEYTFLSVEDLKKKESHLRCRVAIALGKPGKKKDMAEYVVKPFVEEWLFFENGVIGLTPCP